MFGLSVARKKDHLASEYSPWSKAHSSAGRGKSWDRMDPEYD